MDLEDNYDATPLIAATVDRGHAPVGQALVEAGAKLTGGDGETVLMWASRRGEWGLVKSLADRGVNLYHQDEEGRTPLMMATIHGHPATAKILFEAMIKEEEEKETKQE